MPSIWTSNQLKLWKRGQGSHGRTKILMDSCTLADAEFGIAAENGGTNGGKHIGVREPRLGHETVHGIWRSLASGRNPI